MDKDWFDFMLAENCKENKKNSEKGSNVEIEFQKANRM